MRYYLSAGMRRENINAFDLVSRMKIRWYFARYEYFKYSSYVFLALGLITLSFWIRETQADEKINQNPAAIKKEIFQEYSEKVKKVYQKVCEKRKDSPLCDLEVLARIEKIVDDRIDPQSQWFNILIGITFAESSLGTDFANDRIGGKCDGRYNLGWAKYKINDDNTRVYSSDKFGGYNTVNGRFTDAYGCNLYPFENWDEYWISKVNGMRYGYKGCIESKMPITCISYNYVWNPNVAEKSWIHNVSQFINL